MKSLHRNPGPNLENFFPKLYHKASRELRECRNLASFLFARPEWLKTEKSEKIFPIPEIKANMRQIRPNLKSISSVLSTRPSPNHVAHVCMSIPGLLFTLRPSLIELGWNLRRSFHIEIKAKIVKSRTQFEKYFLKFYRKATLEPRSCRNLTPFLSKKRLDE